MRPAFLGVIASLFVAVASLGFADAAAAQAPAQTYKVEFYNDVHNKHYEAAIVAGAAYRKREPADDRFSLDYAYALLAAHRTKDAMAVLERLRNSNVVAVRAAARKQLLAQAPAPAVPGTATAPGPAASAPPFTNRYELLAGGDLGAARDAFVATLATHPTDAAAWRQLSYVDFVLKDRPAMIDALDHYIALMPDDDRAKLERAYALLASGDTTKAHAALVGLAQSSNTDVATAARNQLATAPDSGSHGGGPHYDAFGYALNDSRFHDTFYGLDARYFLAQTKIQPYLAFHLTNDSKSSSVPASDILNDNVAIVSAGLRTAITPILYAYVEGGDAKSLLTGHEQTDLRYGLLVSTRLGAGGFKPQTQIDASITHYSRYVNTISYGTAVHDFYIGSKHVRGVVGLNVALDTSRAFYNNALESFAGAQVRSGVFTFRLIGTVGTYLPRGSGIPAQRTYSSIRPELLFGYSR